MARQMPSDEDIYKRSALRLKCAEQLESDPMLTMGWTRRRTSALNSANYVYDAVVPDIGYWTFFEEAYTFEPTVRATIGRYTLHTTINSVDDLRSRIHQFNLNAYGMHRFMDATRAIAQVKKILDLSLPQTGFTENVIREEDGALVIYVTRISDSSAIKISFEIQNPDKWHVLNVACTTEVQAETGDLVELPVKETKGLKDIVSALRTAALMRRALFEVPDVLRKKKTDASRDARRDGSQNTAVSLFTVPELMEGLTKGCDGFYEYFIRDGTGFTTLPLVQPYVYIKLEPDVKEQKIKASYSSGNGVHDKVKTVELFEHTGAVANAVMRLMKSLVRMYINSPETAKQALESILIYRASNVKYTPTKSGFDIKIKGKISGKLRYKKKEDDPLFTLEVESQHGDNTTYKCHHPSRVASIIDRMIQCKL